MVQFPTDNSLNSLTTGHLSEQQATAEAGRSERIARRREAAGYASQPDSMDTSFISVAARQKYEAEREALYFAAQVPSEAATFNHDKVSQFKELMNTGRIHNYLAQLDNTVLVDKLLLSPAGAFLAQ